MPMSQHPDNRTDPSGMDDIATCGAMEIGYSYVGADGNEVSWLTATARYARTRYRRLGPDILLWRRRRGGWRAKRHVPWRHVRVARRGSRVTITGTLTFIPAAPYFGTGTPSAVRGSVSMDVQIFYLGAINSRWTGSFGRYNVSTNMVAGPGGLPTFVTPAGSNGWGDTTGSFVQFSDNRVTPMSAGNLAGMIWARRSRPPALQQRPYGAQCSGEQSTAQNIADAIANCIDRRDRPGQ